MTFGASDILGTGEVKIPPNLDVRTPEQRELYKAALEFERFFVQHMMKQMKAATDALKSGDDPGAIGGGGTAAYEDMVNDQMTSAVLDGGGLGLASVLYEQVTGTGAAAVQRLGGRTR